MKQTNDLSTVFTEVFTGVITAVRSARRLYYINILLCAIIVAGVTFVMWDLFLNHQPGVSAPQAPGYSSSPARRRLEPRPRAGDDAEDIQRLIHPNDAEDRQRQIQDLRRDARPNQM
jgi:hypothetical protein